MLFDFASCWEYKQHITYVQTDIQSVKSEKKNGQPDKSIGKR